MEVQAPKRDVSLIRALAESAPAPERKEKPRPFAGSSIFITQSLTTNTVFRGQTQYDFTKKAYWFGAARYEDDRFSTYDFQSSLSTDHIAVASCRDATMSRTCWSYWA